MLSFTTDIEPRLCRLTPAEQEVARAVLRGETNLQIAIGRGRSPRTVANQLAGLFRKLGIGSRSELVRWMLCAGVEE